MKTLHNNYCNSKQGYLPLFLSDCLDLLDPVLTFDRLMGGIDLNKYLTDIPEYTTGRLRYNPVNMLKTVLFGFMTSGYCSLRELEDNCKVNIRFMYLMDHQTPSYRTFGYFINEILQDKIENIFNDINHAIIELVFDAEGHGVDFVFRYCNDEMAVVEGVPVSEMLNHSFYEVFENGDKKWLVTYADVALNGNKHILQEYSPEIDKTLTIYCFQPASGYCACVLIPS